MIYFKIDYPFYDFVYWLNNLKVNKYSLSILFRILLMIFYAFVYSFPSWFSFLFFSTFAFDAFGYKKHSQEMMNKTYLWCFWVCLLYSLSYSLLNSFLLMLLIFFFSILFIKINEQEDVFGIIQKWIGKEIQKIIAYKRNTKEIICLFLFAFVLSWGIGCSSWCRMRCQY